MGNSPTASGIPLDALKLTALARQKAEAEERAKIVRWLLALAEDFVSDEALTEVTEGPTQDGWNTEIAVLRGGAAALATAAKELEERGHLLK